MHIPQKNELYDTQGDDGDVTGKRKIIFGEKIQNMKRDWILENVVTLSIKICLTPGIFCTLSAAIVYVLRT